MCLEMNSSNISLAKTDVVKNFGIGINCYFAHPYNKRKSKVKYRIKKILRARNVNVIDPFIGEYKILKEHGVKEYYEDPKYKLAREIWIRDLQKVRECQMLLAWSPEPSLGTAVELFYAYTQKKFVQIISEKKHPLFAYVLTGGNQLFETVDDFDAFNVCRWKVDNGDGEPQLVDED